jgi:hypothetical protein
LKVFEDDLEIKRFLETVNEFLALHIDQDPGSEAYLHADYLLNTIVDYPIVQLPSNHIPKGMVPLERLFDNNNVAVKGNNSKEDAEVAECNIGTKENPKFVNL